MQSTNGSLTILDPHADVKVFWNGITIPVLDVRIKKHVVVLVVPSNYALPTDLDAHPDIEIVRKSHE